MAFIDYLWIIRLIIKILQVLNELEPDEKASLASIAKDMQSTIT
jgi:hypothetical protein